MELQEAKALLSRITWENARSGKGKSIRAIDNALVTPAIEESAYEAAKIVLEQERHWSWEMADHEVVRRMPGKIEIKDAAFTDLANAQLVRPVGVAA